MFRLQVILILPENRWMGTRYKLPLENYLEDKNLDYQFTNDNGEQLKALFVPHSRLRSVDCCRYITYELSSTLSKERLSELEKDLENRGWKVMQSNYSQHQLPLWRL